MSINGAFFGICHKCKKRITDFNGSKESKTNADKTVNIIYTCGKCAKQEAKENEMH